MHIPPPSPPQGECGQPSAPRGRKAKAQQVGPRWGRSRLLGRELRHLHRPGEGERACLFPRQKRLAELGLPPC